jgi:hypothetical protein
MKKQLFFILCTALLIQNAVSQSTKGIHLQAIARNNNGIVIANKQIALRLSIISDTSQNNIVYQEIKSITTNALGLFFVDIGAYEADKVITIGDFKNIVWNNSDYFLQIEIDPSNSLSFVTAGIEKINYVPLALYADRANMVNSIVPIDLGGTGVSTLKELLRNLNLDKINNTADSLKPISIAANIALNDRLKKVDTLSLSNRINLKLNASDTLKLSNRINLIANNNSKNNYAVFYDTSRQSALINTATAVKFFLQQLASKINIANNSAGSPTRMTVTDAGVYRINFNLEFIKSDAGTDDISIWLRRNGNAFANTNCNYNIQGGGYKNLLSGQYLVDLGADDYIEIFFSVKNVNTALVGIPAITTTPARPATPAAMCTMQIINE